MFYLASPCLDFDMSDSMFTRLSVFTFQLCSICVAPGPSPVVAFGLSSWDVCILEHAASIAAVRAWLQCRWDTVPDQDRTPLSPALGAQSLIHSTTQEVPVFTGLFSSHVLWLHRDCLWLGSSFPFLGLLFPLEPSQPVGSLLFPLGTLFLAGPYLFPHWISHLLELLIIKENHRKISSSYVTYFTFWEVKL